MPRTTTTARRYGKKSTRTKAEHLFMELPQSPLRKVKGGGSGAETIEEVVNKLAEVTILDEEQVFGGIVTQENGTHKSAVGISQLPVEAYTLGKAPEATDIQNHDKESFSSDGSNETETTEPQFLDDTTLRTLTWDDVCPPGDQIIKIAEASYAEVYRVINERGTSIIKVIRLESPIKPQTKAQVRSGLVDEEPHSEADVQGELQISEWLADIPGFVVYKERYIVQGKTTKQLLETHQAFQKRMKRQDPDRAQFYPSPSRYLADTKFLAVELGDAGKALEDWELVSESQMWDVFFLEAIALARAEEIAMFEHRDLHEGNICIKQTTAARRKDPEKGGFFGYSGIDITILDYGLSRAEDLSIDFAKPLAYDLERDLSLFTSSHAPQCKVYRQMRSFLLRADRKCLPPEAHHTPYAKGANGPLSWEAYAPYTNVLWLAYLYEYLTCNFAGDPKELKHFQRETKEMWKYLNPEAKSNIPCFGSAEDIVCFAVEAGWVREDQLVELGVSMIDKEDSIILSKDDGDYDTLLRRSPRRQR